MALTVKQCSNSKPGRLSDGRGLYLLTKPTLARSWVLRVQQGGDRKDYGLGSFTETPVSRDYNLLPLLKRRALTLEEARDKAALGRPLAKAGINPSGHWNAPVPEAVPTFEKVAREYHLGVSKSWRKGKHGTQWLSSLETHAFPLIGSRPVDQIDANAIQSVLNPIWLSKGETARRVRQRIGVVLDYAKGKGWREAEAPLRAVNQLMRGIKQAKAGHFAAMPYSEVPAFMAGLRDAPFSIGRHALQFLILTVPRSGEVRKAQWREIDLEAAEWRQPPENTKAGSATSIVQTDPNGNQQITRVYDHGCKVFNLCRGLPVCAMTSGLGNIGPASIGSVAKDLRRLLEGDDPAWAVDPENYTIEDIATKARQYIFDERITAAGINVGGASLNFWVGGYDSASDHAELWSIIVENGVCPAPAQSLDGATCGWQCSGQPEALNRLLLGFSQRLPELLASIGVDTNDAQQVMAALGNDPNTQLIEASMPTQDAINLADYLVETVKGYVRFLPGPDVVGGDTDMAVVTKHEHFKWIKRKHYYPPHLNMETDHA